MVSLGFAAKGAMLLVNNYPILELARITPPIGTVDDVDLTNHDSPDDTEEFVAGLIRVGEFTVEGNLVPTDSAGQVQLAADLQNRTERNMAIHLPGGKGSFFFSGYTKAFNPTLDFTGKAGIAISIKAKGKSTFYSTATTGLTTPFFALRDNGANAVTPTPAASGSVYWYKAILDAADTAIAVQPTSSDGTIRVNGSSVVSGNWSPNISISSGTWKMIAVVVNETGKASKVYRIWVQRPSP